MPTKKNSRTGLGTAIGGFLATGALMAAIWMVQSGAATRSAIGSGYPGPDDGPSEMRLEEDYPSQTVGSPEELCAAAFPFLKELPEGSEKRRAEEASYMSCVEARQSTLPTPFPEPLYGITPVPTVELTNMAIREVGDGKLVENGASFLPRQAYEIINTWSLRTEDRVLLVQAGGHYDEVGQPDGNSSVRGVVVVFAYSADRTQSIPDESGEYLLSHDSGPLRIVDALGDKLTLVAADSTVVSFDILSRKLTVSEDQSTPQREAGSGTVLETSHTPYDLADYEFTNQWFQDDGQRRTIVLAGTEARNHWQSVLVIVTANSAAPEMALTTEVYIAPVQAGRLLVSDATDSHITLAEPAGGMFIFDLDGRRFLAWPGSD